jgi:predicted XRE-type DNA-binding protein
VPLVNPQDELSPVFEELTGLLKDMKSNAEVFAVKQWMEEKVTALKAHQIEQQTLGDAVKIRAEGSS